ncbi:MAG: NAD(P)H-dependent oxidoreductase, partial [Verrucomicrobiota bacterium]
LIFAHPALEKSRANRRLLESLTSDDPVTLNDLYEKYPDFIIDVGREKALLEANDRIVFQFPFYWYSTPALIKEWLDLVLQYGWAYGKGGTALHGKTVQVITTTGGSRDAYTAEGHNKYPVVELLRPLEQTANLCGMVWVEPVVIYDALNLDADAMTKAVNRYRACLFGS